MAQVHTAPPTLAEFLASPAADVTPAWEYLPGGQLVRKVSPSLSHSAVAAQLARLLLNALDRVGIAALVLVEARAVLADASPVPDVSVYPPVAPAPDGELPKYAPGAPLVAIEILSSGQSRHTQLDRCRLFVRSGSALALLIDTRTRRVLAVTSRGEVHLSAGAELPFASVPELAALHLTVAEVFAQLPQR
jgi:Uma2 family endonuclease